MLRIRYTERYVSGKTERFQHWCPVPETAWDHFKPDGSVSAEYLTDIFDKYWREDNSHRLKFPHWYTRYGERAKIIKVLRRPNVACE